MPIVADFQLPTEFHTKQNHGLSRDNDKIGAEEPLDYSSPSFFRPEYQCP